ncbi:MAG: 4-hydroxy-tetrahydrodipicolinate reductase [Litorivicinus sp.]
MGVAIPGVMGRMGKVLAQAVSEHEQLSLAGGTVRPGSEFVGQDAGALILGRRCDAPIADSLAAVPGVSGLIDFTSPELLPTHLDWCVANGVPAVIGTTGLNAEQKALIGAAATSIPVVFAPNMSVGVNVMLRLLKLATELVGEHSDIEVIEAHHRHKKDAPSGTAVRIGEVLADVMGWELDDVAVYGREGITGERPHRQIGFETIRAGDVFGDHTVLFAADGERLEITHKASSRMTFATGAVRAMAWLKGKPAGLYGMDDVIGLG